MNSLLKTLRLACMTCLILVIAGPVHSAQKWLNPRELPVIELDEYEVIYSDSSFMPQFRYKSPEFTYYDVPDLPRGDMILALNFIDQYRLNDVPGKYKWAGLLNFPVMDGNGIGHIKWLCLYMYDDVMYGFDPAADRESDRRFVVPIRFEDRLNRAVLFQFAESYVETIFPETYDTFLPGGLDDAWDYASVSSNMMITSIEAGQILPVLSSQQGKDPLDLVRLVYQFFQNPNPAENADATMGPSDAYRHSYWAIEIDLSWENIDRELGGVRVADEIQRARRLIAPRWSQQVVFHYKKGLLLWNLDNISSIMLFNVGQGLFAYTPRLGVWRTDATVAHLDNPDLLKTKLRYPGIRNVDRIELVPN
ncbi:MAG: hypothetical protein AB3N63_11250 [Puniceicoccaceae bacterium]